MVVANLAVGDFQAGRMFWGCGIIPRVIVTILTSKPHFQINIRILKFKILK